jgi:hypothetical protein
MITLTLFGEGHRREQLEKEAKTAIPKNTDAHSTPVPVPVPVPAPDKAKPEPAPVKKFM